MAKFYDEFSKGYDKELLKYRWNLNAAEFLTKKIKKYLSRGEMLDLGAGTGLVSEVFVKQGYSPATLIDFSKDMLKRARERRSLKGCRFINKDVLALNLNKKYDLIVSTFSLGSSSYFNDDDKIKLISIINRHLKKGGVIAVLGHQGKYFFRNNFKTLEQGIYTLSKGRKFYTDYYIGRRK